MKMPFVPTPQTATVGVAPKNPTITWQCLCWRIPVMAAVFFLTLCPCCVLFFQVWSGEMKTLSLFFLLVASGACDDVKYISKRNSGRMKRLFVRGLLGHFELCQISETIHWWFFVCLFVSIMLFQTLFALPSLFKDDSVSRLLISSTSFFPPSSCCQIVLLLEAYW